MRSLSRIISAALVSSFAVTACDDPTRALSPDRSAQPVELAGRKDLALAMRGDLRSYPEHVIAEFNTQYSISQAQAARGLTYEWTFDGGARQTGEKVTHAFATTGSHDVTLRVTDMSGASAVLTKTVNVSQSIAALDSVMVGVVPGGLNSCAVDAQAAVYCWGNNEHGIIGDGTNTNRLAPAPVLTSGIAFAQIAAGLKHNCALSTAGEAYCWGRNFAGQLGDGTTVDHLLPTKVLGGLLFTTIDVGLSHTCAVTAAGAAYCWGSNELGQLGDGAAGNLHLQPYAVVGGHVFSIVRTGNQHTCALESVTGHAFCWGGNYHGQIGNGAGGTSDTDAVTSPTAVTGGNSFSQLDAGASHNCGISGKFTYCWGWNVAGQLGTTSAERCVTSRPCMRNPTKLPGSLKITSIGLGTAHSCGLDGATGDVYCWGSNTFGQLGDGTTVSKSAPTRLTGVSLKTVRGGNGFTCGVGVDGHGYCWGYNALGTLGLGDTTDRLTPTVLPSLTF